MGHAGVYGGSPPLSEAVAALRSDADGRAVVAKMKEMQSDDPLFGKGVIRPDGRKLYPAYLFEVKTPEESKISGRCLQPARHYPCGRGFPADEGWPLPDDQRVTLCHHLAWRAAQLLAMSVLVPGGRRLRIRDMRYPGQPLAPLLKEVLEQRRGLRFRHAAIDFRPMVAGWRRKELHADLDAPPLGSAAP